MGGNNFQFINKINYRVITVSNLKLQFFFQFFKFDTNLNI